MKRFVLAIALLLTVTATLLGGLALAQQQDTSALKPPKGYKVAIVVFEDLQCPTCAHVESLLKNAQQQYRIPLVRHDFPLPQHNWSFDAHVMARYFDSRSPALGEEFRHFIFSNQNSITRDNLRGTAEKWAQEHKIVFPFVVDPAGRFAQEVRNEFSIGRKAGIQQTPTIYIVSDSQRGKPFVEVADFNNMFQIIDQMIKDAGGTR